MTTKDPADQDPGQDPTPQIPHHGDLIVVEPGEPVPQMAEQARLLMEEKHVPPLKRIDPPVWRLTQEDLQQLADLVRLQRVALQISHLSAGARCGLSESTMKNIEGMKHSPTQQTIRALAKLGIDVTPFLPPKGT